MVSGTTQIALNLRSWNHLKSRWTRYPSLFDVQPGVYRNSHPIGINWGWRFIFPLGFAFCPETVQNNRATASFVVLPNSFVSPSLVSKDNPFEPWKEKAGFPKRIIILGNPTQSRGNCWSNCNWHQLRSSAERPGRHSLQI